MDMNLKLKALQPGRKIVVKKNSEHLYRLSFIHLYRLSFYTQLLLRAYKPSHLRQCHLLRHPMNWAQAEVTTKPEVTGVRMTFSASLRTAWRWLIKDWKVPTLWEVQVSTRVKISHFGRVWGPFPWHNWHSGWIIQRTRIVKGMDKRRGWPAELVRHNYNKDYEQEISIWCLWWGEDTVSAQNAAKKQKHDSTENSLSGSTSKHQAIRDEVEETFATLQQKQEIVSLTLDSFTLVASCS